MSADVQMARHPEEKPRKRFINDLDGEVLESWLDNIALTNMLK